MIYGVITMKLRIFIPLFIFILFSEKIPPQTNPPMEKTAVNALQTLNDLSHEISLLEKHYSSPSAKSLTGKSDLLCSYELIDNSGNDFDSLLAEIEKISLPGDALAVYSSITNDYMPEIAFSEVSFRLLNSVQKHLEELFQNLRSDRKMVSMAIFATSNVDISQMKTRLMRRQIRILSECGKKEERLRCWLAIGRMLNEIDIPKSESGSLAVQNSPYGIAVLSGEIMAKLVPLSENETDDEIKVYSARVLKAIETAGPKYKEGVTLIALNELENFNPKDRLINSDALALFHRAEGINSRAEKISIYTDAIKLDARFTAAYNNRGTCFFEEGDYNSAEEDFRKVLSLDPGYYTVYKYLGNCSYKKGRLEDAVKNFSEALKYEVNDTLLINRGICYQKLGQLKLAVSDFSSALRFNSNSLPARINRVQCRLTLKEYDEAEKDYLKLIRLQPGNSIYYYNLGCIYSIQKNWKKVVDVWEKGLIANPNDENILKNLPRAKANLASQTEKKGK